jgi:hypothetical protein
MTLSQSLYFPQTLSHSLSITLSLSLALFEPFSLHLILKACHVFLVGWFGLNLNNFTDFSRQKLVIPGSSGGNRPAIGGSWVQFPVRAKGMINFFILAAEYRSPWSALQQHSLYFSCKMGATNPLFTGWFIFMVYKNIWWESTIIWAT